MMNYKHTCTVWLSDELDPAVIVIIIIIIIIVTVTKRMAEIYAFH